VLEHLGLTARDYDAAIRRYIPAYDEMIRTVVSLVSGADVLIDLGTGTGALAGAILDANPRVRVKLVDIDPAMLEPRVRASRFTRASRARACVVRERVTGVRCGRRIVGPASRSGARSEMCALRASPRGLAARRRAGDRRHYGATKTAQTRTIYDAWAAASCTRHRAARSGRTVRRSGRPKMLLRARDELALLSAAGFESRSASGSRSVDGVRRFR